MDRDEAGRSAAPEIALTLVRHFWVRVVELPDGTEPDTVNKDQLRQLIRSGV
jgi:DNA primase